METDAVARNIIREYLTARREEWSQLTGSWDMTWAIDTLLDDLVTRESV